MTLLAFGLHTLLEITDESYRLLRAKIGARRTFFDHIRTLTTYLDFANWSHRMDFMMKGLKIGSYTAKNSLGSLAGAFLSPATGGLCMP
jgi:hypothetical protein